MSDFVFKIADSLDEFAQIHRLNHATFVEEIPQHARCENGTLVDRFHDENRYVICLRDDCLLGMLALRAVRPFSLDAKVPDLDAFLPPSHSLCEVRLLAIEASQRRRTILRGLLMLGAEECEARGHDLIVISAIESQRALYDNLGFVPFGPRVGTATARFQPMYLTREIYQTKWRRLRSRGAIS